jgi:hypothetical protein
LAIFSLLLLYFVAVSDPDWFNPKQVLDWKPHHEQMGVVLGGIALLAPFVHPRRFHLLVYTFSLLSVAWIAAMVVAT